MKTVCWIRSFVGFFSHQQSNERTNPSNCQTTADLNSPRLGTEKLDNIYREGERERERERVLSCWNDWSCRKLDK
jgi:hypothetical protein